MNRQIMPLLFLLAGCADEPAQSAAADAGIEAVAATDSIHEPARRRDVLPAERIYYRLTDHDWYARGEPLVHDGAPFAPAGRPLEADAGEMEAAGTYQGVDYYRRPRDDAATLYVPVFEGYWQVFRPAQAGE